MFVVDLTGAEIKITNLEAAIEMARAFLAKRRMEQSPGLQRFEEQRQVYWQDMLDKLLALRDDGD